MSILLYQLFRLHIIYSADALSSSNESKTLKWSNKFHHLAWLRNIRGRVEVLFLLEECVDLRPAYATNRQSPYTNSACSPIPVDFCEVILREGTELFCFLRKVYLNHFSFKKYNFKSNRLAVSSQFYIFSMCLCIKNRNLLVNSAEILFFSKIN